MINTRSEAAARHQYMTMNTKYSAALRGRKEGHLLREVCRTQLVAVHKVQQCPGVDQLSHGCGVTRSCEA
jgi:hypothetical protein